MATTPYTYLIGWSHLDKWYYGVRFAKKCNPNDLWNTYFTSSNYVKRFRQLHGEPNVIVIRKIFDDTKSARLWETKTIIRMKMVSNPRWLNMTDLTGKFYYEGKRKPFTEEHKRKLSLSRTGKKQTEETIQKRVSKTKGMKRSLESKKKLSDALKSFNNNLSENKIMERKEKQRDCRNNMSKDLLSSIGKKGGQASSEARRNDPDYTRRHSERMKLWWIERKKQTCLL